MYQSSLWEVLPHIYISNYLLWEGEHLGFCNKSISINVNESFTVQKPKSNLR